MIRIKEIQKQLKNVVGWEQGVTPDLHISEDLTTSESGLYFQGGHPLCTLQNIKATMPENYILKYPEWDETKNYLKGDKVRFNGYAWKAAADNVNTSPDADFNGDYTADYSAETWQPFNFLEDYLQTLTDKSIADTVNRFITEKLVSRGTKNLIERLTFFDGAGRLKDTIGNNGKLVGFEIVPLRSLGVTTKIERIGLQFTGGTGVIKIYIFHSSQTDPIYTYDLNFDNQRGTFQWFDLKDCYLPNMITAEDESNTNSGGAWYLCYNQNDLPAGMYAINFYRDWSREPCGTCNKGNLENYKLITQFLQVSPCQNYAPQTFAQYPELWDVPPVYTNTLNYGLNLEISVGCDLTDFICMQRGMFATALQKTLAYNVLKTAALNPDVRVNRFQSNVSTMDIMFEIDGNTNGRETGLKSELDTIYKALSLDTNNIDRICLTCHNGGVKYKTV